MKYQVVIIFSFLLFYVGCGDAPQPIVYDGFSGNAERWSVRVGMPEDWKIINAHLESKQVLVEYDRGRGTEKQYVQLSFAIKDLNEHIQFRGANRINDLAILHFTVEEDPQSKFNPPLAKSENINGFRTREEYAIFRTSNYLMIYFTIENKNVGKFLSFAGTRSMKNSNGNFKLVNGVLHFSFDGKRWKRKLPIDEFMEPDEEFGNSGEGSEFNGNILKWTSGIEIVSKQKFDR